MSIETAFKSHTLETCIELCSPVFIEVYDKVLNKHKKYDMDPSHQIKYSPSLFNNVDKNRIILLPIVK